MKKTFVLFMAAAFMLSQAMPAAAQESSISADSSQASSQESLQSSSDQSTAQSSANSDTSSADSSGDSSAQSSDQSSADGGSGAVLVIGGAVIAVGLTVGGIILTVNATRVKEEDVTRLQDQIYLAEGAEYEELLAFFGLDGRTVGRIHDELVASRAPIASSQDAADFLALLALRLAERSRRFQVLPAGA